MGNAVGDLASMASVAIPHRLIREDEMHTGLTELARAAGVTDPPPPVAEAMPSPIALDAIYDPKIEKTAYDAYRRDYLNLGFQPWKRP